MGEPAWHAPSSAAGHGTAGAFHGLVKARSDGYARSGIMRAVAPPARSGELLPIFATSLELAHQDKP
jgi:hypothetical protein